MIHTHLRVRSNRSKIKIKFISESEETEAKSKSSIRIRLRIRIKIWRDSRLRPLHVCSSKNKEKQKDEDLVQKTVFLCEDDDDDDDDDEIHRAAPASCPPWILATTTLSPSSIAPQATLGCRPLRTPSSPASSYASRFAPSLSLSPHLAFSSELLLLTAPSLFLQVVTMFYASWSSPSKAMYDVIAKLAAAQSANQVVFCKIDIEESKVASDLSFFSCLSHASFRLSCFLHFLGIHPCCEVAAA
jgi:thiol-disulfide isomerase/thioredoxin